MHNGTILSTLEHEEYKRGTQTSCEKSFKHQHRMPIDNAALLFFMFSY